MRSSTKSALLAVAAMAALACASTPSGRQVKFSEVPPAPPGDEFPNWYHPPVVTLEQMIELDRAEFEIRSEEGTGAGTTGATKVEAYVPAFDDDLVMKAKPTPGRLDGWNNSPRKEIAAYRIQELFLEPVDYVVPTTNLRCPPLEQWAEHHGSASATVKGTSCKLITAAFWMKDVTLPKPLYDEERFLTDGRYAQHLANFNVLTYLVNHHDNRSGNFLVSKNDADRRIYAIDNGTTFGAWFFNWFYPPSIAWRNIRVPALPKATVERLRKLQRQDLDWLAVLVQMEADDAGILRIVAPEVPFDPDRGARVQGTTVQMGLTTAELDTVWERIQDLLAKVDDGELTVF